MPRLKPLPRRRSLAVLAVAAGGLALPASALAAGNPGAPVTSGTSVLGTAAAPDGTVVAVGSAGTQILVQRVTASGALGATIPVGPGVARAVAVQSDGRIVIAGSDSSGMLVRRLNADGTPDTAFGVVRPVGAVASSVANAVGMGPNGTIVVAGGTPAGDGFLRVTVARLLPTGALDGSFGTGGVAMPDLNRNAQAAGLAVLSNGSVVLAGRQTPDLQATNAFIAKVTGTGATDPSFNGGAPYFYFHPKGGGASVFNAVAIDASGRIVGAGADVQSNDTHALFVRLGANGQLDAGFGAGGILDPTSTKNYNGVDPVGARGVAIAGGGEIVAAGATQDSGQRSAALYAITPAGQLDAAVGAGGIVTSLPGGDGGESRAVAVTPDGTIFAGGDALDNVDGTKGFVLRYSGFGALPGAATTPTPTAPTTPTTTTPTTKPPTTTPTTPTTTVALKLTGAKLSTTTLKASTKATLRFTLSKAARVKLTVQLRNAKKKYVTLSGSKKLSGKKGANKLTFTRKFGSRTLKKGSYRLVITVTGGPKKTLAFTVR